MCTCYECNGAKTAPGFFVWLHDLTAARLRRYTEKVQIKKIKKIERLLASEPSFQGVNPLLIRALLADPRLGGEGAHREASHIMSGARGPDKSSEVSQAIKRKVTAEIRGWISPGGWGTGTFRPYVGPPSRLREEADEERERDLSDKPPMHYMTHITMALDSIARLERLDKAEE